MIHFDCPHCAKPIRLKDELAGRKGMCPHCKKPIQAPAAAPAATPMADLFEEAEESEEPVISRRETAYPKGKKRKQANPLPLLIGGASVAGVLVVGLVLWFVFGGSKSPQPNSVAQGPAASNPAGSAAPRVVPGPLQKSAGPSPAPGAAGDMIAYLPAGLEAMAGVRVAESLKAEDKKRVRAQLESTLQPVLAQTGLALDQLEDVVLGSGSRTDELLIAIRTAQPLDGAAIRKSLGCTASPQKVGQVDVYPLPADAEAAESIACFPDPRTLLLGSKELVQKALEAPTGSKQPPVLATVREQTGVKTHLWLVAGMPLLKSQVAQIANWGVSETVLGSALDKIGQVALGFDLTQGMQLRVAMECRSESEAKAVRTAADALRLAIRDAEKKQADRLRETSGGSPSAGATKKGGGMPGGPAGPGGAGGPGGMPGGPGGPGGMPGGGPGMPKGGTPGQAGGGAGDSSAGAVWNATEVKQTTNQVLVTLPPVKVEGEAAGSPLDLFGSAAQVSFARTAIGSPLFPGSLRRSSTALRGIEQKDGVIPAGTFEVESLKRPNERLSWMAALLPYLGQQELYDQIDFAVTWIDKKNIPVAATIVDAFLDPLVPQRRWKGLPFEGVALTHYVGMGGVGSEAPRLPKDHPMAGIFGYDRKTALSDIRDGASNTILMIQARDVFGPWLQGGGATVRAAQSPPYIGVTGGFGSPGPDGGVMTIFADGSVRYLSKDIDPKVFEALCTINGGETVDLSKFAPATKPAAK